MASPAPPAPGGGPSPPAGPPRLRQVGAPGAGRGGGRPAASPEQAGSGDGARGMRGGAGGGDASGPQVQRQFGGGQVARWSEGWLLF